jgi:hypothetical protein
MQLPENIADLCRAYTEGLRLALGCKLHGLYVYGASVFPETVATGDVDFHAILEDSFADSERAAVLALHETLAIQFPPLGAELDSYYLLLEQARQSGLPTHQLQTDIVDKSWALHRAHMLAGRCVVLYGPDPSTIFPVPTWPEIEEALAGELAYVEKHLDRYPDYCILNLCRLMYSYRTGDVVTSKAAAGVWAATEFPQWHQLIELANRSYAGKSTDQDRETMRADVKDLLAFAHQQIQRDFTGPKAI